MAHFAELGENNVVVRVITVNNSDCVDSMGIEQESIGAEYCRKHFGGVWKQTSYNRNFRKNYAGPGFIYDSTRDAFVEQQPYASWILNEETCVWEAPVPRPTTPGLWAWNEESQQWIDNSVQ
jgi:hypothetical protein